jgi:YYY domain-containing protein
MATSGKIENHNSPHKVGLALAVIAILLIGAALRFYNVNWDEGTYHIHPDERHTTMVVSGIQWPATLGEYFDTSYSPLNPRNANTVYFYGTLPLFLTKYVATELDGLLAAYAEMRPDLVEWAASRPSLTGYDQIHLVGRVLSGLFDLGSVLLLFSLARRLFDWRVGLIASFLLALAVLNIQGSHYFTVDTFLTFFVELTIWFTLDVVEGKGWPAFVALGLSMGFTLASKVSVFLLAVVIGLGAWLWVRRQVLEGQGFKRALLRAAGGLILAALVAIAIFRVAQPYAWAGPNYDRWDFVPEPWGERLRVFEKLPEPIRAVITPNPQWVADIVSAGAQQTGEADLPWGRQWTERTPWLYPLENMVLWGLGVPLGIAAWLGVGLVIVQIVRAWRRSREEDTSYRGSDIGLRSLAHWDLVLIPLAWVLLTFLWQGMQFVKSIRYFLPIYPYLAMFAAYLLVSAWDWAKGQRWGAKVAAGVLGAFVLVGTLAWAWAFIQIYREPVTRVQATRWMYDNIENGAAIANEHFDDPLPFNMDGRVAFGSGAYQGLDLALYNEDTPEKLEEVLDVLDEADYISMSSGRLHTSIPRLPMRYPVTTRYYELLFAEKLGFEKAAEFHSYPRLFGIEFNDDRAEEQFTVYDHPKVLIYRKTDDYNRDRVRAMLTEGIDWEDVAHWLNPRDVPEWKRTHQRQNDLMLTEAQRQVQVQGGTWASLFDRNSLPNRLPTLAWLVLLTLLGLAALPLTIAIFRWLPDRGYILARPVGVLLLAWLSWMLTNLTPLGYTRGTVALALALIASLSLGSLLFRGQRRRLLDLWRTRKGLILISELLFLAFFALFWLTRWGNPDLWHAWKGGEKPMDFAYLNAVIKSTEFPPYDPWFSGGYLNYYYFGQVMVGSLIKLIGIVPAVAYNLAVPAWAAMTAMGAFSVTYNLVPKRPKGTEGESPRSTGPLRPVFFGLVGAVFVILLGNLGQVPTILLNLGEGTPESFQSTIPGLAGLVRAFLGTLEVLFNGRVLPMRLDEWYWNASRAIPAGPYEAVITEFPFFTFLYADLHAHLIAMPLAFVSLALALAVVKGAERPEGPEKAIWRGALSALPGLLLWSLAIGAMRTTNTWDVPPHLIVVFGALVIAEGTRAEFTRAELTRPEASPAQLLGRKQGGSRSVPRAVASVAWQFGLVFLLSWTVLYQPFWASYGSFYNSTAVWTGTRTVPWAYMVVHGLFLFAIISYLSARVIGDWRQDLLLRRLGMTLRYRGRKRRLREAAKIVGVRGVPVSNMVWVALALLILIELFFLVPGLISFTQPKADVVEVGAYTYRGLAVFALGLPVALLGLLLLFRPSISSTERLWAYLVLLGLAMSLGVEVIVLQGDIGRMNTVFKFYLQVWLMWGVAAAAALAWMVPRLWSWDYGRGLWLGALAVLLFSAALYPPLATWARVEDRFDTELGPGLDGWAYMETARYWDPNGPEYDLRWDLEAIQWLLDNVVGSPTILEGHTPEYRWGARYSINTGLPTVLGWNWHQRQQRAAGEEQEVWVRAGDVADIYNTPSPEQAESLLHKYDVCYVIVGPLERAYYDPAGLDKFEQMVTEGRLKPVFHNDEVMIYAVAQ